MPRRAPQRTRTRSARKKNTQPATQRMADDIWRRTRLLVEVLLEVMEQGIRDPQPARDEQWERLFGSKDSAVVTLQKLVQLLAELQQQADGETDDDSDARVEPVSPEEMALLKQWLDQAAP